MVLEQCKGVHCVDIGESFQTHTSIYLPNLASIQPRTSALKFAAVATALVAARSLPPEPRRRDREEPWLRAARLLERDLHTDSPFLHLRVLSGN